MSNSAASFIDQIKAEYRAVVEAETNALPHAIKCGEYLILAQENLKAEKGGKWLDWLETNCQIPQTTASLYMRLAKHKKLVGGKAKSINEARKLLPTTPRQTAPKKPDEEKPASGFDPSNDEPSEVAIEDHRLADLGADELCLMLVKEWEDEALRELAKRITDHLAEKAKLFPKPGTGTSNAITSPGPTPTSPSPVARRTI
jgi:hypothetical protein